MPKYLFEVDYSVEAPRACSRRAAASAAPSVEAALKSVGGKLEAFYFTFGTRDAILICELPNDEAAIALSMNVGASGSVALQDHAAHHRAKRWIRRDEEPRSAIKAPGAK